MPGTGLNDSRNLNRPILCRFFSLGTTYKSYEKTYLVANILRTKWHLITTFMPYSKPWALYRR